MNYLVAPILTVAILYAWAGLIFAFFCLRFDGSEGKRKRFLEKYYRYFTQRITKPDFPEVTPKVLRVKGKACWGMVPLPALLLCFGFSFWNVVLSIALLFFGGLFLALSWYGLRCLRGLGLGSFSAGDPNKAALVTTGVGHVD